MKKILVALDYDPTAKKIAECGFELATALKAEMILLHVIADPVYYSSTAFSPIMGFGGYLGMDFMDPDIIEGLKRVSLEFLEKTKQHLGSDHIRTMVQEGDSETTILEVAKKEKASIIVMGSHSRKWLEAILVGSTTEKVLHKSSLPLYIIPTKKIS